MPGLVDVVRRFRGLRALAIGDVMLDSYLEGTAARLCSEGPVPVVRQTAEKRAPGGAANTAANLRALGASVDLLGLVGADAAGALLRSALRERGVDPHWLVEDAQVSTLHKLRILADGQYVVRFDEGETRLPSEQAAGRLVVHLDAVYPRCDVVVVSDYRYGVLSDGLLARLRALRTARPRALVVDSKALRRFAAAGATVVTPNYDEAQLLVEPTSSAPAERPARPEVERLGRRLLEAIDAELAAITLGGDGVCLVAREGGPVHLPAPVVPRAHDVGAGDSFAAALALALAAGAAPVDAVQIGVDAAGIAVGRPRTAVVAHQDLLRRVSLRAHAATPTGSARDGVERLAARLDGERAAGRCIVFTNGVFDILHAGHVKFLQQAKALGDVLVVGVNTDASVRRLKGERRPINPEGDRLALVDALDAVDHAVLFDDDTPARLIRALRPHVHVKGGDYAEAPLPEAEAVHAVGGRVVILPLVGSLSTTAMIDRIVARAADAPVGATR